MPGTGQGTIHRRDFLAGALVLGVSPVSAPLMRRAARVPTPTPAPAYPFTLGVASGYPVPTGVVLWTRLAPEPLVPGGGMPPTSVAVEWEIAADEAMTRNVQRGTVTAVPEWAHAVHVEVDGLEPARWYWYRFHAGGATSRVARTRTAPAAGTVPDRVRFAFASCQHRRAAAETFASFVVEDGRPGAIRA